jgi:hypothetical protein
MYHTHAPMNDREISGLNQQRLGALTAERKQPTTAASAAPGLSLSPLSTFFQLFSQKLFLEGRDGRND